MEPASIQGVTPPPISLPSIGSTLGALLICTFVTLMLYGLAVHQTYRYVYLYPADALILKFIAYGLFITDTFHCVTLIHLCYHYLISNFLNPLDIGRNVWSSQMMSPVTGVIVLLTQSFYLRRIYIGMAKFKLRYRVLVGVAVGSMMLTELGLVTASTCKAFIVADYEATLKFFRLDSILFGVAILTDCTLTGTLVAILHSRRTEFAHTNNVLNMLALYAVIATALSTALTIPAFAFVVVQPYNFIWIAISTPVTKVYSNSVLAMLNCRLSLREVAVCVTNTPSTSAPRPTLVSATEPASLMTTQNDSGLVCEGEAASSESSLSAILLLLEEGSVKNPETAHAQQIPFVSVA